MPSHRRLPQTAEDHPQCIKKERISLLMHSRVALPQAKYEYTKKKCAQTSASQLSCRSGFENVEVFQRNDLLALMLNLPMRSGVDRNRVFSLIRQFTDL